MPDQPSKPLSPSTALASAPRALQPGQDPLCHHRLELVRAIAARLIEPEFYDSSQTADAWRRRLLTPIAINAHWFHSALLRIGNELLAALDAELPAPTIDNESSLAPKNFQQASSGFYDVIDDPAPEPPPDAAARQQLLLTWYHKEIAPRLRRPDPRMRRLTEELQNAVASLEAQVLDELAQRTFDQLLCAELHHHRKEVVAVIDGTPIELRISIAFSRHRP